MAFCSEIDFFFVQRSPIFHKSPMFTY